MNTKKTAFVAVMWLTAFGLLGAPTTPAVDILPTVGGQAHGYAWWADCGPDLDTNGFLQAFLNRVFWDPWHPNQEGGSSVLRRRLSRGAIQAMCRGAVTVPRHHIRKAR